MQLLQVSQLLAARRLRESVTVGVNETTLNNLNQTTLSYFNYTSYNNGTLSNGSSCFLIFDQFVPTVFPNGTFVNGTSCYFPYYPIDKRGSLGLAFAVLFALSIMFTLVNLSKHGRLYLPQEKRFRAIGRRWQWYWMLFVAVCGVISGVSAIDVDRDYLQNLAIILQNFFFYLMMPGILACVWEGVRHWYVHATQFGATYVDVSEGAHGKKDKYTIMILSPFHQTINVEQRSSTCPWYSTCSHGS